MTSIEHNPINVSLDDKKKHFDKIPVEDKKEYDYTICDTIISKMNLKQGELDTLNCYMAGMTYCEIARFLGVNFSTIYNSLNRFTIVEYK